MSEVLTYPRAPLYVSCMQDVIRLSAGLATAIVATTAIHYISSSL